MGSEKDYMERDRQCQRAAGYVNPQTLLSFGRSLEAKKIAAAAQNRSPTIERQLNCLELRYPRKLQINGATALYPRRTTVCVDEDQQVKFVVENQGLSDEI